MRTLGGKNIQSAEGESLGPVAIGLMLLWWAVIATQSVINLGTIASLLFLGFTVILFFGFPKIIPAFLAVSFVVPLGGINLPSTYVLLFLIGLIASLVTGTFRVERLQSRLVIAAIVFLIIILISLLFSGNIYHSLDYMFRIVQGVLFVVVLTCLLNTKSDCILLLRLLAIASALMLPVISIHYIYGESAWLFEKLLVYDWVYEKLVVVGDSAEGMKRFIIPGMEPNYWAGMLLFPFSYALGMFLTETRLGKLFWVMVVAAILFEILGTFSRSGLFSASVMGVYLFVRLRSRFMILGLSIFIVATSIVIIVPGLWERFASISSNIQESGGSHRYEYQIETLKLFCERPWGWGIGGSALEFGHPAHSTYINILADLGVVGFVAFVYILWMGFSSWLKLSRVTTNFDSPIKIIAECCTAGALATALHIATITAQDPSFYLLPFVVGFSLWSSFKRKLRLMRQSGC